MNRRNFVTTALTAAFGFTILPTAVTYKRNWNGIIIPPKLVCVSYYANNQLIKQYTLRYSNYFKLIEKIRAEKRSRGEDYIILDFKHIGAIQKI